MPAKAMPSATALARRPKQGTPASSNASTAYHQQLHFLMVEQAHTGERHDHTVAVGAFDHGVVADGPARLGNIGNAALFGALDVIAEREKRVRPEGNAGNGIQIGALLGFGEGFGAGGKILLPNALGANVLFVLIDIAVDHVVAIGAAECGQKRKIQHLLVLAQKPGVGFGAGKARAVNAGLLTRANADCLTVYGEADRVGLRIFEGDERNDQIADGALGQGFIFGD